MDANLTRLGGLLSLLVLGVATVVALLAGAGPAQAVGVCDSATVTWSGGGADRSWDDPDNWVGQQVPTAASRACVPASVPAGSQPSVRSDVTVADVEAPALDVESPATLTVTGSLSVGDLLVNGSVSGAGSFVVHHALRGSGTLADATVTFIGDTAEPVFEPSALRVGTGALLDLRADLTLGGYHYFTVDEGGRVVFSGHSTIDGTFSVWTSDPTRPGVLEIPLGASLTGVAPSGGVSLGLSVQNDGTLTAAEGAMSLPVGGPTSSSGSFVSAPSGALSIGGSGEPVTLGTGAVLDAVTVAGPVTATGPVTGHSILLQSDISGGPVTLTGSSQASSTASMSGAGTTVVAAGASLAVQDYSLLTVRDARVLDVRGVLSLQSNASVYVRDDTDLRVSGRLDLTGNGSVQPGGEDPGTLHITAAGELRKTTDGAGSILVPLDVAGAVRVTGGTLTLSAPGTSPLVGALSADPGESLVLDSPVDAPWELAPAVSLDRVTVRGGIRVPTGSVTGQRLQLEYGTLLGPGQLVVTGASAVQGAFALREQSTVVVPVGAELAVQPYSQLDVGNRTAARVHGTLRINEQGQVYVTSGGLVEVDGTARLERNGGVAGAENARFDVLASGRVETGALAADESSYLYAPLRNDGTVVADAGTLTVGPSYPNGVSFGDFRSSGAGALRLSAGDGALDLGTGATLDAVHIDGSVRVSGRVSGSEVVADGGEVNGPGTLVVEDTLHWRNGSMAGTGTTLVQPGALLDVDAPSPESPGGQGRLALRDGREVVVRGSMHLDGYVETQDATSIDVRGVATLADDSTIGGAGLVLVDGLLQKTSGAGRAEVFASLHNEGTVRADAGTLSVGTPQNFAYPTGVLTGGTWTATAELALPVLSVNAASLVLDGPDASFGSQNAGLAELTRNAEAGRLTLLDGADITPYRLANRGVLALSPGSTVTPEESYTQATTGTLRSSVDGSGIGHVLTGGTSTLAGGLTVVRDPAYDPAPGTVLGVVVSAGSSGTFTRTSGLEVGASKRFVVGYGAQGAKLEVTTNPAPPAPTGLAIVPVAGGVALSWDSPSTATGSRVVMRSGTVAPTTPGDGTLVYAGTAERAVVSGLVPGRSYAFSVFGTGSGQVSRPVSLARHGTALTVRRPAAAHYRGRVTDVQSGHLVRRASVDVWRQGTRGSSWRRVRTVSATDGTFSFRLGHRPYGVRVVYRGAGLHLPSTLRRHG